MKKKGIATLALAGALAVSMVPAFAAGTDTTTVGYTAGGNIDTDGRVMVTVPMDVTFTAQGTPVKNFDVKALVWDAISQTWVTPASEVTTGGTHNAPTLGKEITVEVTSTTGFKLLNETDASGVEGEYTYVSDKGTADTPDDDVTMNTTTAKTKTAIGTLTDTSSVYKLGGTVTMTKTPDLGQANKAVFFSDTLTYSFTGLK